MVYECLIVMGKHLYCHTRVHFRCGTCSVQVRRTDKVGTEASYHGIEEYMFHVNQYYEYLETRQTVDRRRVYIATDDARVLGDAKEKYV